MVKRLLCLLSVLMGLPLFCSQNTTPNTPPKRKESFAARVILPESPGSLEVSPSVQGLPTTPDDGYSQYESLDYEGVLITGLSFLDLITAEQGPDASRPSLTAPDQALDRQPSVAVTAVGASQNRLPSEDEEIERLFQEIQEEAALQKAQGARAQENQSARVTGKRRAGTPFSFSSPETPRTDSEAGSETDETLNPSKKMRRADIPAVTIGSVPPAQLLAGARAGQAMGAERLAGSKRKL